MHTCYWAGKTFSTTENKKIPLLHGNHEEYVHLCFLGEGDEDKAEMKSTVYSIAV